jgi:outer membrane protein assembly factor BamA
MASRLFVLLMLGLVGPYRAPAQDLDTTSHQSSRKKFDLTGVPVISYNTSYGAIIGANSMLFFNVSEKDTISPASVAGMGGGFSQSRSLFAAAFTLLYFGEDRWRVSAAGGVGDIYFQYFESGVEGAEEGFVDYNTVTGFGVVRILRKVVGNFYAGGLVKTQYTRTDFESDPPITTPVAANGIGINALFDSRNDIYYPTSGRFASVSLLTNPSWLGSDSVFHSVRAFYNSYIRVARHGVVAIRASIFSGLGDVPFIGQHAVGGKDIRGYTDGKYRGNQAYSAQVEYRLTFRSRWGMVGFMGVAMTSKPYSGFLPAAGAGLRYRALPSRNINVGVDAALGKDDFGVYFRIGEVF